MEQRLIYIIRNGETNPRGNGFFLGQTDWPLSEEGIKQAERLRQELSCVRISHIFCSDLQRSLKTAQMIAEKQKINPVARKELREINLGEWDGRSFEEIKKKYPTEFKNRGKDIENYRPPGGESFADCSHRAVTAYHEILNGTKGNLVITGHAGINRVILCHLLDIPLKSLFKITQDYGCLNLIWYGSFGYRLRVFNRIFRRVPY